MNTKVVNVSTLPELARVTVELEVQENFFLIKYPTLIFALLIKMGV